MQCNNPRMQRIIQNYWSGIVLKELALIQAHFLSVFPTSWVKDRWGHTPPVTICPFYLREKLAGTLSVCPAFESIAPPNRLPINAHIADYISDGCLGGKHLNGSTNRQYCDSVVPCQVFHPETADSQSHSATTLPFHLLVVTDIYAILVPSNVGNLQL